MDGKTEKTKDPKIELKSKKLRNFILEQPHTVIRWGTTIVFILIILLLAFSLSLPYPYGNGETVMNHLLGQE